MKKTAEFYCPKCGWINEPIKEQRIQMVSFIQGLISKYE